MEKITMSTDTVENKNPSQMFASEDLIEVITQLQKKAGSLRPEAWLTYLDQQAYDNAPNQDQKRFLINRAFRQILSQLDQRGIATTLDERFYLVDQGPIAKWVQLFDQGVIPCLIRHGLPLANQ